MRDRGGPPYQRTPDEDRLDDIEIREVLPGRRVGIVANEGVSINDVASGASLEFGNLKRVQETRAGGVWALSELHAVHQAG